MNRRFTVVLGPVLFSFIAFVIIGASVLSGGAPSNRTGAPGAFTCADTGCHVGNAVNSSTGSLEIEAPSSYSSGVGVDFLVKVQRPSAASFGFSITVRNSNNQMVGSWEVVPNSGTALSENGLDPTHVTHDQAFRTSDEHEWALRWIPPASDAGEVTFYASANAADGTGSQLGDFIFTTSHAMSLAAGTTTELLEIPRRVTVESTYPNPGSGLVSMTMETLKGGALELSLFDASGKRVKSISQTVRIGTNVLNIETSNLPSGVYVYRVTVGGHSDSGSLLVSR